MSILGLDSVRGHGGEVSATFRGGWFRTIRIVLGSAGGAAVILAIGTLVKEQPDQWFHLLMQWGPWPIIVLVALGFLGHFLSGLNDTIRSAFSNVVSGVQEGVSAHTRTADALTRLAERQDRHAQEVERLATYAAQEVTGICERMDTQDSMLVDIKNMLSAAKDKLDHREGQDGQRN
jgi:hypothetical protein